MVRLRIAVLFVAIAVPAGTVGQAVPAPGVYIEMTTCGVCALNTNMPDDMAVQPRYLPEWQRQTVARLTAVGLPAAIGHVELDPRTHVILALKTGKNVGDGFSAVYIGPYSSGPEAVHTLKKVPAVLEPLLRVQAQADPVLKAQNWQNAKLETGLLSGEKLPGFVNRADTGQYYIGDYTFHFFRVERTEVIRCEPHPHSRFPRC